MLRGSSWLRCARADEHPATRDRQGQVLFAPAAPGEARRLSGQSFHLVCGSGGDYLWRREKLVLEPFCVFRCLSVLEHDMDGWESASGALFGVVVNVFWIAWACS